MALALTTFNAPWCATLYMAGKITGRISTKLVVVSYANAERAKNWRAETWRMDSLP
jgi:hypothetical protein